MMRELTRMTRFAAVGVVGFIVDGGLLQATVTGLEMDPIQARAISFPAAVFVTWLLNRAFTFRNHDEGKTSAWGSAFRYLLVSVAGTLINFVTYAMLIMEIEALRPVPIIPLALASIVAMVFNYAGNRYFTFRSR